MRLTTLTILSLSAALTGCAAQAPAPPQSHAARQSCYLDAPASTLVFSPPVAQNDPEVDLPRDIREPAVFIGFDDVTATYFHTRTDDRMIFGTGLDRYERRTIMSRTGVSYR